MAGKPYPGDSQTKGRGCQLMARTMFHRRPSGSSFFRCDIAREMGTGVP